MKTGSLEIRLLGELAIVRDGRRVASASGPARARTAVEAAEAVGRRNEAWRGPTWRRPRMEVRMRKFVLIGTLALAAPGAALLAGGAQPDWAMNATVIEACSCPMFCQCYFNAKPANHAGAGHEGHQGAGASHFCRANNAYKINKGHYGEVKLDGAKFWIATDLGGDFSKGEMDWAILYFDKVLTPAQREAIGTIAGQLFPVKWRSFKTAEGSIDTWQYDKDTAVALLDGGKTGEVRLKRFPGMTDEPVVIKNLRYWGAPRNDGFIMMPNEVEAYRVGDKAFEFKGTNGFMITLDMNSRDFAPAKGQ